MDQGSFTVPLSPGSKALFSAFTTLYDDFTLEEAEEMELSGAEGNALPEERPSSNVSNSMQVDRAPGLGRPNTNGGPSEHAGNGNGRRYLARPAVVGSVMPVVRAKGPSPKRKENRIELPGYMCFSSASGKTIKPPKRSAFTEDRKEDVKRMRKLGACLRCKIRKITVSKTES